MKKVLIVGGAGYIGGFLTDVLRHEYDVTVYDSLVYETRFLKDIPFVNGDIRNTALLKRYLDESDIVIWLAAIVGDGACAVDPDLTLDINLRCVRWLMDNYDGKIIFASTCSVYGANNNYLDETSGTCPLSLYATTKLDAEKAVLARPGNLAFRLGTLYGVGDSHSRIRMDLVANVLTYRAVSKLS
jgi:nucleoside-diphosphate-sugar epimerase